MGKQSQFSGEPRKSLLPKAAEQFYDLILEEMISKSEEKVDPPKDLQEFEDRLSKLVEERFERNLGLQHYLQNRKYIKSEPTVENLIEIECELEKQSLNGVLIINQQLDPYK